MINVITFIGDASRSDSAMESAKVQGVQTK